MINSRVLGAAAAASAVLLASGCAGVANGAAGAPPSPSPSGDGRAAFAECMREHGVTLPPGHRKGPPTARPSAPGTVPPSAAPSAPPSAAPPSTAPSGPPSAAPPDTPGGPHHREGRRGGFGPMSPELREALEACRSLLPEGARGPWSHGGMDAKAFEAFRTCMKDNGAEITGEKLRDPHKRDDPKVADALKKCRTLLPAPGPGHWGPGKPGKPGKHWHDGRRGPGASPHGPGNPGPGATPAPGAPGTTPSGPGTAPDPGPTSAPGGPGATPSPASRTVA